MVCGLKIKDREYKVFNRLAVGKENSDSRIP